MRILHILAEDMARPNGGLGVAVEGLTEQLQKQGMDCVILNIDTRMPVGRDYIDDVGRRVVYADCRQYNLVKEPFKYYQIMWFGMINAMLYRLGRERFDLIHVHDSMTFRIAEAAAHLYQCPVLMTSHLSFGIENMTDSNLEPYVTNHDIAQETICMGLYHLATVSQAYGIRLLEHFRPRRGVRVIPNGIKTSAIDDAVPVAFSRPTVYMCGRMVPGKGHFEVIKAAEACPEYDFVVFANQIPDEWDDFHYIVRKFKSAERFLPNFFWHKNRPYGENFAYLKGADIALVPSTNEAPFDITGLEAMAAGVPLITTGKCGIAEYANESNCTLIEPTAESLIAAIKSHKRDNAKVERAKETAARFTWAKAAERYIKYYNDILKEEYAEQDIAA